MVGRGYLMETLKKWWEGFLRRLTKVNKESFGGGRVDCCGLGKAAEGRKHS